MTKYILVGGYIGKSFNSGEAFYKETLAGFKSPVKVLDCLFARPKEVWEKTFAEDLGLFQRHVPDASVDFKLARVEAFPSQVAWADVVYFRGGVSGQLKESLQKDLSWLKNLSGKTIAGSSAGADVLSRYFYNLDTLKAQDGLGLLPIKFIPHYRSDYNAPNIDWDKAEAELKAYKEDLPFVPFVPLREGEFNVFER